MSKNICHLKTLGILSLALFSGQTIAATCYVPCQQVIPSGFYVSAFGGGGSSAHTNVSQRGTAFYSYDITSPFPGPLAVDADGHLSSHNTWFAGANLGYAWKNPAWIFTPAVEFEGLYLRTTLEGTLDSHHTALPEHIFDNSLPINTGVYLINSVFTLNNFNCWQIRPYIGAGIGGAVLSVSNADSLQVNPVEAGVNHFNSERSASDSAFSAQIKAGLSYDLTNYCSLFAEYRFLYLAPTRFDFGSTVYPEIGHVPTAPWGVNVNNIYYNLGSVGIKFTA